MCLYAHVMPVFSLDAPAVSGVVLELWPSVAMPTYSHTTVCRRLYAHVMPVFSIDALAVSGVVLELWPSVWDRDAYIQSYDCMQASRSQTLGHSSRTTPLTAGTSIENTGIT